ncbi:MAG: DUF1905 domain-containing protein [Alphaproteobacteria bacterium]|nr:DUF1905 domain-containing protein [Alphaproteobacteria bacterium]
MFEAELFTIPGKGGWTFVKVPEAHAPEVAGAWGRTPVLATVDGEEVETSVWRTKDGEWWLPVAKPLRRGKTAGDTVSVSLRPQAGT